MTGDPKNPFQRRNELRDHFAAEEVERELRHWIFIHRNQITALDAALLDKAADLIAALRSELARLRK